ncbi:MAG TPA: signal peptidase I [Solirubrobacteraceae bacterium]|jgi:signal peptidase I|nr:signal peptidase I [Solirubrobacteraceae bacterium]
MALGTIFRAGRLAAGAALVVAVVAAIGVLAPSLWGWQRYAIVSGSMTGTYDRGSLVFAEVVPVADLRVGDVITYQPPPGAGPDHLITHRIASMGRDGAGKRVFRTKGDANPVADPWTFRLEQPTQARARIGIPYVGHALSALGRSGVRTAVITLPALLLAAISLAGLWRRLGAEAARRAAQVSA